MSKDTFQGKEGKWVTINGAHVFIPDGQTLDDVYNQMADDAWESEYTKSQYADSIISEFTYADFKYWYEDKLTHERVKPAKHAKQVLRNCLEHREIVDPAMDELVLKGLQNNVNELIINDRGTNWFRSGYHRRIQLDIDGNDKNKILESLAHEIGHAIDFNLKSGYMSSTWKSPTFGVTMEEMLSYDFTSNLDLDMIQDEVDIFEDLKRQVRDNYEAGEIDATEYKRAYFRYDETIICIADMVQAYYGEKECEEMFGYLPHQKGYFESEGHKGSHECFAELTSCLFWDKEKRFSNFIEQYCPDTIKIYKEIIEEVKKSWQK